MVLGRPGLKKKRKKKPVEFPVGSAGFHLIWQTDF